MAPGMSQAPIIFDRSLERVQSTFLAIGVPATFLIDRGGTLRWRHIGPVRANDSTLVREIERSLAAAEVTP